MDRLSPDQDAKFEELAAKMLADEPPKDPPVDPPVDQPKDPPSDPDVEKAIRGGIWKPKEEFVAAGGDPDEWVSARRFNLDGKKIAENRALKAQLARNDQQTKAVVEHIKATERRRADEAIEAVKNEKWAALEVGDLGAARKAEAKEEKLRSAPPPDLAGAEPPDDSLWRKVEETHSDAREISETREFQQWLLQQPASVQWAYNDSTDPRDGVDVFTRYKGVTKPPPRSPPPVAEPRRTTATPKDTGYDSLSRETKSTYLEFQRLGMADGSKESKADYAKECALRGET